MSHNTLSAQQCAQFANFARYGASFMDVANRIENERDLGVIITRMVYNSGYAFVTPGELADIQSLFDLELLARVDVADRDDVSITLTENAVRKILKSTAHWGIPIPEEIATSFAELMPEGAKVGTSKEFDSAVVATPQASTLSIVVGKVKRALGLGAPA